MDSAVGEGDWEVIVALRVYGDGGANASMEEADARMTRRAAEFIFFFMRLWCCVAKKIMKTAGDGFGLNVSKGKIKRQAGYRNFASLG